MPLNPTLNITLKEMWRLDEKISDGESLTETELEFYNKNLAIIAEYYAENNTYWSVQKSIRVQSADVVQ